MPQLHRPADDRNPQHYPLRRIVIELQAPAHATVSDMLADLDEIAAQLRSGETTFAAEALFGYRVTMEQGDSDMFTGAKAEAEPMRVETFADVFDAIAHSPEEADAMRHREDREQRDRL